MRPITKEIFFSDIVTNSDMLMGVKALWGRTNTPFICFTSKGFKNDNKGYYSNAKYVAEAAETRPYFVTIGAGEGVSEEDDGVTLELIKASRVYGETKTFIEQKNQDYVALSKWPICVVTMEIYEILGGPHLIRDLGFNDRKILQNAYDRVIRYDDKINKLYDALKTYKLRLRTELSPPANFINPSVTTLRGQPFYEILASSPEGKKKWALSRSIESDPKLKKAAKYKNRETNNGILKCEACDFSDQLSGLFDAHHLYPLCAGERETTIDDLAILCPTCHRWAHRKTNNKLKPISILEIRSQRQK